MTLGLLVTARAGDVCDWRIHLSGGQVCDGNRTWEAPFVVGAMMGLCTFPPIEFDLLCDRPNEFQTTSRGVGKRRRRRKVAG